MPLVEATWNLDGYGSELTPISSDDEDQECEVDTPHAPIPQPAPPSPAPAPAPAPAASRPRARVRAISPAPAVSPMRAKSTRASTQEATKKSKERSKTTISAPVLKPARPTSYSVESLVKLCNDGMIDLNPEYQRGVVWNESKQSALIDSVYRNFHVPQLLFHVIRDSDGTERRICIDGKQRLTSFKRFLNNEIPYKDPVHSGKNYWFDRDPTGASRRKLITPQMKTNFMYKQISCMEYEDVTPEQERELFQRVQLGVTLGPADRLPAINGAYADLIRELRRRVNTTKGFEGYLAWGRERGRDFQALAQIVYLILNGSSAKKAEPTSNRLEKWLTESNNELKNAEMAAFKVMAIYCRIAQHPELGVPLTQDLSPLEFVMSAYLIHLQRKRLSDTQLSDAITHMRTYAMRNTTGHKFNTKNFKHIMAFLQKDIPKLIPKLNTDPSDPLPANDRVYHRIEAEVDQFKGLDSTEAIHPDQLGKKATGKRKKEEDEDADDESDCVAPIKKKRAPTRKVESQTPRLETQEEPKPKVPTSRLLSRAPGSSKTTIKKGPTKAKSQSAVGGSSTSGTKIAPSTVAATTTKAAPAMKATPGTTGKDTQTAIPTVKPPASARSLSRAGSATARDVSNSCAPTPPPASTLPPPTTPAIAAARPPFPGRSALVYNPPATSSTTVMTQNPVSTSTSTNSRADTACTVMNANVPLSGATQRPVASSSSSAGLSAGKDRLAPLRSVKAALAASSRCIDAGGSAPMCSGGSARSKLPSFKKTNFASEMTDVQPLVDAEADWGVAWGNLLQDLSPTSQTTPIEQQRPQFALGKSAPPSTLTAMVSAQVLVPHGSISAGPVVGIGPASVRSGPLVTPASTPSPTLQPQAQNWARFGPRSVMVQGPTSLSQPPASMQPVTVRDPRLARAHANRVASQLVPTSSTTTTAPSTSTPAPQIASATTLPPSAASTSSSYPSQLQPPPGPGSTDNQNKPAGQKRTRTDENPAEEEGQSGAAKRPRSYFPAAGPR